MANMYPSKLAGGGGGGTAVLEETTLWTNSDPTANFSKQDVTLSDSVVDNGSPKYDFIKFVMRASTSSTTEAVYLCPTSLLISQINQTGPQYLHIGLSEVLSNIIYARSISLKNATTITFGYTYKHASATSAPEKDIPLSIIGCTLTTQ